MRLFSLCFHIITAIFFISFKALPVNSKELCLSLFDGPIHQTSYLNKKPNTRLSPDELFLLNNKRSKNRQKFLSERLQVKKTEIDPTVVRLEYRRPNDEILKKIVGYKVVLTQTHTVNHHPVQIQVSKKGRIIHSDWNFLYFLTQDGQIEKIELYKIDTGERYHIKLLESENDITFKVVHPKNWINYFSQNDSQYAWIRLENGQFFFGIVRLRVIEGNYKIVELTDQDGKIHSFDPYEESSAFHVINDNEFIHDSLKYKVDQIHSSIDPEGPSAHYLKNLISSTKKMYSTKEVYDFFELNPDYLKKLLMKWYPIEFITPIINKINSQLGLRYLSLLYDPSIIQKIEEFLDFATGQLKMSPDLSSFELRQKFSNHLGNKKVYRTMWLTEQQVAEISKNGHMTPASFRPYEFEQTLVSYFYSLNSNKMDLIPKGPQKNIFQRMAVVGLENSLYLSASDYPEVALSVGYHANKQFNEQKHFYLFEIELPELDIIRLGKHFFQKNYQGLGFHLNKELVIGDTSYNDIQKFGIEVFLPLYVDPKSVISITQVESQPPEYKIIQKK